MSFNKFNDEFNNEQEIKIDMPPEEEKSHKKFFSQICCCVLVYILISQGLSVLSAYFLPEVIKSSDNAAIIISSAIQYLVAFPIFCYMIKKIPVTSAPKTSKLSLKELLKFLTVTIFLMYLGNYISLLIMSVVEENLGITPENTIDTVLTQTDYIISIVIVGIIGPIVEEMIFRKLLIDRLVPYGERVAVLLPALIFGLVHGNLYQFFYAFLIGIALSYIYVKTGKMLYTAIIHCFINLFFGVFASYVMSFIDMEKILELATDEALFIEYINANIMSLIPYCIYLVVFYAAMFIGIFNFNKMIYKFRLEKGKIVFPKGKALEITMFNPGAIALITACVILIAISTFSV